MDFFYSVLGMFIPVLYYCIVTKKEEIVQAALKLLIQNGVHATPMSAIAKAAGTGMGTIYNYFAKKEELINAIYVHIKKQEEKVFSAIEPANPIKTQFEDYYRATLDFFISNEQFFRFMYQLHPSPIITAESRDVGRNAVKKVYYLLKKGQDERIIKLIDVNELIQFISGTLTAYLNWHFNNTTSRNGQRIDNQLKMVWDAIKE